MHCCHTTDQIGHTSDSKDSLGATLAVERELREKLDEIRSIEDFGAVPYATPSAARTSGATDSTQAIQNAIDWAYNSGGTNAIYVPDGFYLCGQIELQNYTTLIGTSRQASAFVAPVGFIPDPELPYGSWWRAPKTAQKICMFDLAWYAGEESGIEHILNLGFPDDPEDPGSAQPQHGTEGIIARCWLRDAPNGHALYYSGNVGYLHDITLQSCRYGAYLRGNANKYSTFTFMQIGDCQDKTNTSYYALDMTGGTMTGVHIEVPFCAIPVRLRGDAFLERITLSLGSETYDAIVSVDTDGGAFPQWQVRELDVINPGSPYVTGGAFRVDGAYSQDSLADWRGRDQVRAMDIHGGYLALQGRQYQEFTVRFRNDGGVLKHSIGSAAGNGLVSQYAERIRQATPTAAASGSTFNYGLAIVAANGRVIFDTVDQIDEELCSIKATVARTNLGQTIYAQAAAFQTTVDSDTRIRPAVDLTKTDGTALTLNLTSFSNDGDFIEFVVTGFIR